MSTNRFRLDDTTLLKASPKCTRLGRSLEDTTTRIKSQWSDFRRYQSEKLQVSREQRSDSSFESDLSEASLESKSQRCDTRQRFSGRHGPRMVQHGRLFYPQSQNPTNNTAFAISNPGGHDNAVPRYKD